MLEPVNEDRPRRRGRGRTHLRSAIALVAVLGAAAVLSLSAYAWSDGGGKGAHTPKVSHPPVDLSSVQGAPARPATRTEVFYTSSKPEDMIAATNSGQLPESWLVPQGIARFDDPGLKGGAAFMFKLRNAAGEAIGFGTEQETWVLDQSGAPTYVWTSPWVITLPGRGSLFIEQVEGGSPNPQRTTTPDGVTTSRTTSGPLSGDRGRIVGGTGEFSGRTGTFYELDITNTTDSVVTVELHLRYDGYKGKGSHKK